MKKVTKQALSFLLVLCTILMLFPIGTASAATSYDSGKALSYAASHWNDGKGLCAEFVSDCLKAGGLSSWNRECTNLYNQLNNEVVGGAKIATVQYLKTSGNYIKTSDNSGKIAKGDVLFWLCSGCPNDSVGGPYQHAALVSSVSGTYVNVYQHNGAVNNQPAWVGNCYECGRAYSHMVAIHFGANSTTTIKEYFSCDVTIKTTKGKTVNLYSKPTDSSRKTYFDQGQTAYSTRGAKLSDGSTWYEIQAYDENNKVITIWLNAASSGVTVINNKVDPSLSFSPSSLSMNAGTSKTVSITFKGDGIYNLSYGIGNESVCSASWGSVDYSTGKTSLTVTGKSGGSTKITIYLNDKSGKSFYSQSINVTVASNVSISTTPSSLELNLVSNPTGTVRVNISGSNWKINGGGDNASVVKAEWVEQGTGYVIAKFTAMKTGTTNFTFRAVSDDEKTVFSSVTVPITVTVPTYVISYNANGGNGAPSSQTKQYDKTLTLSSTKPTKSGYTFKGWATSSGASSAQYQPGSSYTENKNLTLYAVWEQNKVDSNITFSQTSITLNPGDSKTISVNFQGEGIRYLGVSPNQNDNSICALHWADIDWKNGTTSVTVTGKEPGTITITVHFLDNNDNSFYSKSFSVTVNGLSYTISYDANGGKNAPSAQTKQHNKTLELSSVKPTKDGYDFMGWATSPSASSTQYQPGYQFNENKNLTLYAVWKAHTSQTVSYRVNHYKERLSGGYELADSDELTGQERETVQPATRSYEGFVTPSVQNSTITASDEPFTISYYYNRAKYQVSVSAGDGVKSASGSGSYRYGETVTIKANLVEGYQWNGWSCSPSISGLDQNTTNGTFTMPASNVTLKATAVKKAQQAVEVHFPKQTIYFQGQFTDVQENQWFSKNVSDAFELGLVKGNSSSTFAPYGDVTLAQAITMASRIHSIYKNGYEDIPERNGPWYQCYLDYAYENGIISWAYYNAKLENKANRAQVAQIMANALPDEGFFAMNSVADNSIPDVPMSEEYSAAVYKLYRAGILTGGDVNGTFSPKSYITRAEAAAIVSRIAESNNRVKFSLS